MRSQLVAIVAIGVCLAAVPTRIQAQTAPAARPAGGELIPFWLVIPAYPQIAQSARVQGIVVVTLTVAADGRVETASFERSIPLLRQGVIEAAMDSGFICRGCTGPMAYRITYDFRFVDSIEQVQDARGVITSTSATLAVVTMPRILETERGGYRVASSSALEHPEEEP